ncbi:MICOS complex subunit Mic10-like [Psammomys obesus]|uniref:MICOS complex subunit Mic10-like n=1 Tax=Psammomys obesus TaxID=48139 RepID=UPI0024534782|nr:MICOS complex subunit Mic10-like [Psammomys obesus]
MFESDLSRKWDRCMADMLLKLGRMWLIAFGSGLGSEMDYSNCQHDLEAPYHLHGKYVKQQ